ncbi:hypothetical protein X798_03481 [Onchocerca flexuosa]|uniref:Uncharacterized protein n=1 Tax=Onchocerca flexuosa TaxID=387005 RepID=A0A238BWW7_9BILA|nr:hypothetical protein X798_03481 [Onchocerca flexuosa]
MNKLYYGILLTLFYKSCTGFLDFPSDCIRRLRALDVIGGYPSFFGAIYVYDDSENHVSNRIKQNLNRFVPLSTVLHFTIKDTNCSNLISTNSGCEMICPRYVFFFIIIYKALINDPNCTIEQQTDEKGNLLKSAAVFEKETTYGYVYGDEIRTNGQLSLLRPGISRTGCDVDDLIKFLSNQMNGTEVCDQTGHQCVVPILKEVATASSNQRCDNYSVMSVRLAIQEGSILGMLIEFLPSSNKCRESYCLLTTEISFEEITQKVLDKMKMSRYENSEGRFRCPSEVTCPAELFYFLNTFDLGAFSAQFLMLIPLLALLLLYVS